MRFAAVYEATLTLSLCLLVRSLCIVKVVLRAPTKRGAVEALDAETKVYVEFFDSFDEDKRSRYVVAPPGVASHAYSMT